VATARLGALTVGARARPRRVRRSARARKEAAWFYVMISPWLIGFLVFLAGPLLASLYFSFTDYDLLSPPRWIGLGNYRHMFATDPLFWKVVGNTVFYTAIAVPATTIVSIGLAALLHRSVPGIRIFRTIVYLPALVPLVASAMLFTWVLAPDTGLLNRTLRLVGIHGPAWLLDETWVKPALILMSLWSVGTSVILLLAGMQGIPAEFGEAARIDGANSWQQFRRITLPMLSPVILFNVIMGMIGSFQIFSQVYILTKGGPDNASEMLVPYLFDQGFRFNKMGYASALSWVLFVIIMAFTALVFRTSSGWVFYESEVRR
jgi:multiple sugar transport system permease protein